MLSPNAAYRNLLKESFEFAYEKREDPWTQDSTMRGIARELRQQGLLPGAKVLDIGLGQGVEVEEYFREGALVVEGIDLVETPAMKRLKEKHGEAFNFHRGFFQDIHALEHRYSLVIDNGCFHHQEKEEHIAYLQKIYSLLKSGGNLFLLTYAPKEEMGASFQGKLRDGRLGFAFHENDLHTTLAQAGFSEARSTRLRQVDGEHFYLLTQATKKLSQKALLFSPLPRDIERLSALGYECWTVWPTENISPLFFSLSQKVQKIADRFIRYEELNIDILRQENFAAATFIGPDDFFPQAAALFRDLKIRDIEAKQRAFYDKHLMREKLRAAGIEKVRSAFVGNAEELRAAVAELGFPCIAKPRDGASSIGVRKISSSDDLKRLETELEGQAIYHVVEHFVEGLQISVEAVSLSRGKHLIAGITEKFPVLPPNFIEVGGVMPARISNEERESVAALVSQMLDLLDYDNGLSHTEIILSKELGPIIVETHPRAGGLMPFLVEATTGKDMLSELVKSSAVQKDFQSQNFVVLKILEFPEGAIYDQAIDVDTLRKSPGYVFHNVWLKVGQRLSKPTNNLDRHGYLIVRGEDEKNAFANLEIALAHFQRYLS
jgi:biotin carboxylase/ubiquinone/menaquinone biosynthesis C-methylase UbiE